MNNNYMTKEHFLACFYMLCFSILSTCLALVSLSAIGLADLLPLNSSLLLSCFIGLCIGLMKSKKITKSDMSTRQAFSLGISLFLLTLPLFDIGALFMMQNQFNGTDIFHAQLSEYFTLYVVIFIYSFIFIGSWLSVLSGFMFLIFNKLIIIPISKQNDYTKHFQQTHN